MNFRFDKGYQKLTFDLLLPEQLKADEYESWVRRILWVSSYLNLDYFKLWDLPEHEFELLEEKALEIYQKNQKKIEEAKAARGGN